MGWSCKHRQEVPECPDGKDHDAEQDKESPSGANKQKEEEEDTTLPVRCALSTVSPLPTILKEMEEMFLRLGFSQTVAMKLVDDQGIDSPWTLASLSDESIATTCDVIRPGGLVSGNILDRGESCS